MDGSTENTTLTILHLTPSYKPAYIYGGPTISVSRLCESQAAAGAAVTVYTTTANGPSELPVTPSTPRQVDGVEVWYFPRLTGDHTHFSPSLLRKTWRTCRQFDAIHIHSWWNLVAVLSALVCLVRGVKPILSPRGMLSAYSQNQGQRSAKRWLQQWIGKPLLRRVVFHATSRQEAETIGKSFPHSPLFILPNLVDLPDCPSQRISQSDIFQMVFISRIDPKKGLELLLPVLSKLEGSWRLDIYGSGDSDYLTRLQEQIADYGLEKYIHWRGWAQGETKTTALAQADLFLLPSSDENFANAVLEALACGTPVLVSDQVGLSDYVLTHDFGWVHPLDPAALLQILELALADQVKRTRIRQEAPKKIRQDFEPLGVARQYIAQYRSFFFQGPR